MRISTIAIGLCCVVPMASGFGQVGAACHAGPEGRPPIGWRRIVEGPIATQFLDFNSFCRSRGVREASVRAVWKQPQPAASPAHPPFTAALMQVRFDCRNRTAIRLRTTYYADTGRVLGVEQGSGQPEGVGASGSLLWNFFSFACERDGMADTVMVTTGWGMAYDLNHEKYGRDPGSP